MIDGKLLELWRAGESARLSRLKAFLSIPSVSADSAYAEGMAAGADFVAGQIEASGGSAKRVETPAGRDAVIGRWEVCSAARRAAAEARGSGSAGGPQAERGLLFYGHYDVQPPDPLELWQTPPFEPTVRDGAIYARGASDDKGQVLCFLEAMRLWREAYGGPPAPVTAIIEGEEEIGSPGLPAVLDSQRDELRGDFVLISDTAMWDRKTPAITYGLRGLLYYDLRLHQASRDVHSGMYGGVFANPAVILARVLGGLFDADHRVAIPGFYDDVSSPSEAEREAWSKLNFDPERDLLDPIGVAEPYGESGYTTLERKWVRPSLDVNGLFGGYAGEGAKTVIPASAGAKLSFRLAPNQSATRIAEAFEAWLERQPVHGCRWRITRHGAAEPAMTPMDSPWVQAAGGALRAAQRALRIEGREPVLVREGATIPVVAEFEKTLGLTSVLMGFGLSDDAVHAPNEKFELACFDLGCLSHAAMAGELVG
jgi:acetylornithine deacetylase/succinyl-diaminopimelate desuccinylase-like protein